ncbi:MAG: trypsin-like peptidase domain-containing protein [Cyclobacteriaceae bacterium]|nr:trypsin-like peptidase domain-containing protein [Cyclobacteriaceae bacterium]
MKRTLGIIVISFVAGLLGAYTYFSFVFSPEFLSAPIQTLEISNKDNHIENTPKSHETINNIYTAEDFVEASKSSTNSVVYIKNISERRYATSWMDLFLGGQSGSQQQVSSGSGVIFSSDGFIVTNNHVVEDAEKVEVIHNKKTYNAQIIGTDPSTDLAVLKIDDVKLPAITIGSSKALKVGEWVIAVGNPFNLTSTVTAGIVSAKGRDINILQGKFPIESFIQTDAAINPGNSGGALVNKNGELVGINTAILSKTGSYAGYGFAVPVDLVTKVVHDLIDYGEVQKAFFGGDVVDLNADMVKRFDLNIDLTNTKGVLLSYLQKDGAASKIGLLEGDIINRLNGEVINSKGQFDEIIGYFSPGDKLTVGYLRDNKELTTEIILTNREGTTGILKREIFTSKLLGADFEALSKVELDEYGIEQGIRVFNITRGLINEVGIAEDFIILRVNRNTIKSPEKLTEILEKIRGRVLIEGINSRGRYENFSFYLR